ncbi:MAG: hypothetical protein ACI90V_001173, partial [Bacillariaceae sp.]|jgi:hypothetical protein
VTISTEDSTMATATAAATAIEMMTRTTSKNAPRRSVISDGVLSSGAIITPLPSSFVHKKSSRSLKGEEEQDESSNGYIPAFEGYLTIGFSVHVPGYTNENLVTSSVDDSLESLIMLFLCSKEVELVISTDPSLPLTPVCPFAEIDSQNIHTSINEDNNSITNYYGDKMIVWNLPKTTTRTVAFDDSTTSDAETETETTTNNKNNNNSATDQAQQEKEEAQSQEYYTLWEFTYPVYQWGSNDNNDSNNNANELLQDEFNTQVIETGTLDSLLPWPNALSSSYGNEPYTFWDETRPPIPIIYNTDIPQDVSIVLMYIGGGMIVINTVFALIMNCVLRYCRNRYRRRIQKHQEEMEQRRVANNTGSYGMTMEEGNMMRTKTEYLDTEEGVSAILMESKQYAITKSMRDSMNSASTGIRSSTATLRAGNTAATKIPSPTSSSPTTIAKENNLVARAKHHQQQQQWHSYGKNNNLLGRGGGSDDDDGEDEDLIANC